MNIVDIDKELKNLWNENKNEKKIKACLFTLIVYSTESIRGDYIREIMHSITQEFPCRIISIQEQSHDTGLTVEAFQHTSFEGNSLIVSDRIAILSSPEYFDRVPFIVIPEIVPDLPVFVIWGADVTSKSPVLSELEKYATKIIFDAESSPSLPANSKTIYNKLGTGPYLCQDFHWALSSGWRECISQAFSNEEGMGFLKLLSSIKLVFNDIEAKSSPAHDTVAWYIQAWLAGQLGLQIKSVQGRSLSYISATGPVDVEIIPEISKKFVSSSVLSILMTNRSGDTYQFLRHPDKDKVIVHITRKNMCEMPSVYPFPDFQRESNFIRELFFFAESPHYANTLKQLAGITG